MDELFDHSLATPKPLTATDAHRMAGEYFELWSNGVDDLLAGVQLCRERENPNLAAFTLHQAAERLYICFLLVQPLYFPRSNTSSFCARLSKCGC